MREEDELLNRTLQRCLREVRRALDADADVRGLATCKARRVFQAAKQRSAVPRHPRPNSLTVNSECRFEAA